MGIKICPQCSGKISDSRNDCPHCNYVFPEVKKCPDCEEEIDVSLSECPICGHIFAKEAKQIINVEKSPQQENNIQDKQTLQNNDGPTCPYCDSTESMPAGSDLYLCTVCKNRFMDTRGLPTPRPYIQKSAAESKSEIGRAHV